MRRAWRTVLLPLLCAAWRWWIYALLCPSAAKPPGLEPWVEMGSARILGMKCGMMHAENFFDKCTPLHWVGTPTEKHWLYRIKYRWASPTAGIPNYSSFDIFADAPVHNSNHIRLWGGDRKLLCTRALRPALGICYTAVVRAVPGGWELSRVGMEANLGWYSPVPAWILQLQATSDVPKGSYFRCSWMGWTSWVCAQGEVDREKKDPC